MSKNDVKGFMEKGISISDLMQRASEITLSGLPLMEGKEHLEIGGQLLNTPLTVNEFGFLEGKHGRCVVFTTREYPSYFMYGASVITEAFTNLQDAFNEEELNALLDYGIVFELTEVVSSNKRNYYNIKFFPVSN